ncbi:hypothetical protein CCM_08415 [Cordyceps militaris CM01]|uniref:Uncharacterized protein n=1 Tax=Cordyceps militaris (strain CM01) TaxID=983644 RepID=G3JR76_CORMM|nr:uncharacterized protein CCM_08415 [Cordyceps militaris CM01]EGX88372.1 hypothetical protein CCM_08415 [Cordyceps militaris CM01]
MLSFGPRDKCKSEIGSRIKMKHAATSTHKPVAPKALSWPAPVCPGRALFCCSTNYSELQRTPQLFSRSAVRFYCGGHSIPPSEALLVVTNNRVAPSFTNIIPQARALRTSRSSARQTARIGFPSQTTGATALTATLAAPTTWSALMELI